MPFYIRKSVSAGPFRFNFSRGGVGASVGVRGLRVGTGPRGHYVHAGRNGFYYRATTERPGERQRQHALPTSQVPITGEMSADGVQMLEVESGDVLAMREESFGELIDEINAKRTQMSMAGVLGWSLSAVGLLTALVAGPVALPIVLLGAAGWAFGRRIDSYRNTCVLYYDLEPEVEQAYQEVVRRFDDMAGCAGRWHVQAGGAVQDLTTWKRNAGATHIIRKSATELAYRTPAAITCNITPPALHVGKQVIYFLPDVALLDDGRTVGAVAYSQLSVSWQDSNFIEEGVVPRDAQVIGQTWKHPNKSGGPDRRFRDNRQIPICRYEAMHLRSSSGVNELVEFSRVGVAGPFADALRSMPKNNAVSAPKLIGR